MSYGRTFIVSYKAVRVRNGSANDGVHVRGMPVRVQMQQIQGAAGLGEERATAPFWPLAVVTGRSRLKPDLELLGG